jgi:AraC-like DNA-binding protein
MDMVTSRLPTGRGIPQVPFSAPIGTASGAELLSLSELRFRSRKRVLSVPLRPTFHHIITVSSGVLRQVVDFNDYTVRPGSWLWVRPNQVHQWGDLRRVEGTLILFEPDFLDSATVRLTARSDAYASPLLDPVGEDRESLQLAVRHLNQEFRQALGLSPEVAVAVLHHLLAALVLRLADLSGPDGNSSHSQLGEVFIRFRELVELDFKTKRRVEDYAESLSYSPRTISRATIEAVGVGPKEFINRRVLLEAKRLLAHSSLTAAQIGDELGFSEAANFGKFFRRGVGESPIDFRNGLDEHLGNAN